MVLYFTGTGNSKCIAERIAHDLDDSMYSINFGIRHNIYPDISSEETLIFCTPTYAWRFPKLVDVWVRATENNTQIFLNKKAYFIMTCASSIGSSKDYIKELCDRMQMPLMGCAQILMPQNYIPYFDCPSEEDSEAIVREALRQADELSALIANGEQFPEVPVTTLGSFCSIFVHPIFNTFSSKGRKFYSTNACNGCGKCAADCPLGNIVIIDGRPAWSNHCTNCMGCINGCPEQAIEFGKRTAGKRRYQCPGITDPDQ